MWRNSLVTNLILSILSIVHLQTSQGFVKTRGSQFLLNGRPFYFNGFNAYWLMYTASFPSTKNKVTNVFYQASRFKMNVARTWAFSDGGNRPLQISPGYYNEVMFKGLDFVLSEAKKHGIYLILSLVNNYDDFGGKKQYVQWANSKGQNLKNIDEFFTNPITKSHYKNHIKTVLTRINSITGIAYKDDPTIFAWELINEPKCSDLSGKAFQAWVVEMSTYLKSIDRNHLLEIGLEGFYGPLRPSRLQVNPYSYNYGTDFISNNRIAGVDFATIHLYPDQWLNGTNNYAQAKFVGTWIQSHIQDSKSILGKPLVLAEFGKSSRSQGYSVGARDNYFANIYGSIYLCARRGGPCAGALFWQALALGMDSSRDGYEVVLGQNPSTDIAQTNKIGNSFVKTKGTYFVKNGRPLYFNGFNAYWLMYVASNPSTRDKVRITFKRASQYGMNVARTWAFSDGGNLPLQISPGNYNEAMFKSLDYVVSQANKYGIYLILSLVNNWAPGGKKQYVQWARNQGHSLKNDDDFYSSPVTQTYYKNYVKTVLTRVNSLTGKAYKDDPTIFAWELMNEPRCYSQKILQAWVSQMSAYVKSIDKNHLLEVGLEGFYGDSTPQKKRFNPGNGVGSDFISNNRLAAVDFTTIHLYPDLWAPGSNEHVRNAFIAKWIQAHIYDSQVVLRKPILVTEFGKSSRVKGYTLKKRDQDFMNVFNLVYNSARKRGSGAGALFWQLMAQGMESWSDGYEVVLEQNPSTASVILQQSRRISSLI
ncbi:hypothetical protein ACJIZ3_023295 [Penstemon smallii]|uniref:mannan endo-1,4-beta-mannosidase n=1 Tax=Penstemon smallii TaxID=265156 RepID=A0ABD3TNQ0_9LAMI